MSVSPKNRLRNQILQTSNSLAEGVRISKRLLRNFLANSNNIDSFNFTKFDATDLQLMFDLIDNDFFEGLVNAAIESERHTLCFRVANRMTNSGGVTTTRFSQDGAKSLAFEIAISSTLLFGSFRDQKPIVVTGLLCGDRLQAFKRIMEHEMIHLIEMLLWRTSSCSATRFQNIARRIFSHKQSTHELITPRDTASSKYAIETGDWVGFQIKGQQLFGYVNRITKRATVLVPSSVGTKYSDGKKYRKYYVPIEKLSKAA